MGLPGRLRLCILAALALAYIVLAHYTLLHPQTAPLGLLVVLAPMCLAALSMAWQASRRWLALGLLGLGTAGVALAWSRLVHHAGSIYWMEHAGSQLMLCLGFGRTLQAGREPLCSRFARMVEGELTPAIARYTRQVTQAWTGFFAAMAIVSTILFHTVSLEVWSVFANFCTAPLIALMFVVEYAVRHLLHPDREHAHIIDGFKAFWSEGRR